MITVDQILPFQRRIRLLYALKGLWLGLSSASVMGLIWVILDWRAILYTEWNWLAGLLIAGAAAGVVCGMLIRPTTQSIALSIDRRAALKDRLGSAMQIREGDEFAHELERDACNALNQADPKKLYPIHWGWPQNLGITTGITALLMFGLLQTSFITAGGTPTEQAELKKEALRLNQLKKAIFDDGDKKKADSPELQALQRDLLRLQKDYEKARLDPKQAMINQQELAKKADELAKQKAANALDDMKQGESAMEKLEKKALEEVGLEKANMDDVHMSQADFDNKISGAKQNLEKAQAKSKDLQKQMDALQTAMNKPGLSEAEKKALQKKMEATKAELDAAKKAEAEAKKALDDLKLSQQARDTIAKLMSDPLMKEIQKELDRLRKTLKAAEQNDKMWKPKMSKAEMEALRKKIEDFMKTLDSDKARKAYLEKMLEALKNAKEMGQCNGMGIGLGMGLGLGMGGPGPGPDNDTMLFDTQHVRTGAPIEGKGKGSPVFAPTERDGTRPGPEMTFEIKAPTFKGTHSSVPYQKVLPSYKQKAESALKKNEIPKEHQERVKRYFDSLSK